MLFVLLSGKVVYVVFEAEKFFEFKVEKSGLRK